MRVPKKFDLNDLFKVNRALRLFKRNRDVSVLVKVAKKVLGMGD